MFCKIEKLILFLKKIFKITKNSNCSKICDSIMGSLEFRIHEGCMCKHKPPFTEGGGQILVDFACLALSILIKTQSLSLTKLNAE
jgi:hypothetical protein